MIKFRSVNKLSQLYVVSVVAKNDSAFSAAEKRMLMSYRVSEMDNKARDVLEWLKAEENYKRATAILFQHKQNIERLEIPPRAGTKKHYEACARILSLAKIYQDWTLRRFTPGIYPELINNF